VTELLDILGRLAEFDLVFDAETLTLYVVDEKQ